MHGEWCGDWYAARTEIVAMSSYDHFCFLRQGNRGKDDPPMVTILTLTAGRQRDGCSRAEPALARFGYVGVLCQPV
jgi:hypothetical protein